MKNRRLIYHILSIYSCVMLIGIVLFMGVLRGFLKTETITSSMAGIGYYHTRYEEFMEAVEEITAHLPVVLDDVKKEIPETKFYTQTKRFVQSCMDGVTDGIDIAQVETQLGAYIDAYVQENQIQLSESGIKQKQEVIHSIASIYKEKIELSFVKDLSIAKQNYQKKMKLIIIFCFFCFAMNLLVLLRIARQIETFYRSVTTIFVVSGFIGIGIWLWIPSIVSMSNQADSVYISLLSKYIKSACYKGAFLSGLYILLSLPIYAMSIFATRLRYHS